MDMVMKPIGFVQTDAKDIPRHWSLSDVEGKLIIDKKYQDGIKDINSGKDIIVLFFFHKSPDFTPDKLIQFPRHHSQRLGVFSICSPFRPNPIGMSVVRVLKRQDNVLHVKRIDMLDGTPILDIKPVVKKNMWFKE
jgi:tRNA-Thr(GGU) m(6)t(6)A37 methyltransferase TsaA